jgi:hypothetical protein
MHSSHTNHETAYSGDPNSHTSPVTGPLSSGQGQQMTITAKPGVWVLVCFMDTQDRREHSRLGMVKTIRITR